MIAQVCGYSSVVGAPVVLKDRTGAVVGRIQMSNTANMTREQIVEQAHEIANAFNSGWATEREIDRIMREPLPTT